MHAVQALSTYYSILVIMRLCIVEGSPAFFTGFEVACGLSAEIKQLISLEEC